MDSMQDPSGETAAQSRTASPGQMLRAAREAKGLHLAVLSVALKVPTRQLEALEADRYDAFKGITFLRALAQTVCRHLGLDPAPVLAGLPRAGSPLQLLPVRTVDPGSSTGDGPWGGNVLRGKGLSRPVWLLGGLMLAGSAALIWWPGQLPDVLSLVLPSQARVQEPEPVQMPQAATEEPVPAASAEQPPLPVAAASSPSPSVQPQLAVLPSPAVASQDKTLAEEAPLLVRASADAWVLVRDSRGVAVLNRQVKAGESLKLDVAAPLFVYAGRADAVELRWRGKVVDLQPFTQNNEARLPIKP